MSMQRRTILKGTLAGGAVSVAVGAGLLTPAKVMAAWNEAAFESKTVNEGLKALLGSDLTEASADIEVKAPDIAENGAVVPVTITTSLKAESITVVAEKNPSPIIASFDLGATTEGYVSTRIKMGKTSNVIAVVKSGGKLYSAKKEVKVTIGGCGG